MQVVRMSVRLVFLQKKAWRRQKIFDQLYAGTTPIIYLISVHDHTLILLDMHEPLLILLLGFF